MANSESTIATPKSTLEPVEPATTTLDSNSMTLDRMCPVAHSKRSTPTFDPLEEACQNSLQSLHEFAQDHPFWENRLFKAAKTGVLTLDDFRYIFGQYYHYSKNFTRYLSALMARCEEDKYRACLIENLYDESGASDVDKRHSEIFRDFLSDGLLLDINSIEFDDAVQLFVQEYLSFCSNNPLLSVSAFLALGTEAVVPRMYKLFVDALKRAGLREEHLKFFRLHIECDDRHAETLSQMMLSFNNMANWYSGCQEAIDRALTLRMQFFNRLFEKIQYRRVQRIIENVNARESMLQETRENEGFAGLKGNPSQANLILYRNEVERLNIDFTVERMPFRAEVLDPRVVRIPAGRFNERHKHAHETIFVVLEGSGQIIIDEETVQVQRGDSAFVPRWAVHQSQNTGTSELVLLAIADFGLTSKAFLGNYYRVSRAKEDLFNSYSVVDNVDEKFWENPYPVLKRAREESPVYYSETFDAWFVTQYELVVEALLEPQLSSRRAAYKFAGLDPELRERVAPFERSMNQWMVFNDSPDHTRLRAPVNAAFSTSFVHGMRPRIKAAVNELLDEVITSGEMDIMRDLASPLPGIVVADMLGVTGHDRRKFEKWSDDIAAFAGASEAKRELAETALHSWSDMTSCVKTVVERRKKEPQDDLLTSLLNDKEVSLTEEELLSTCVVLLAAGHGATQDTICNCLLTLLRNPQALDLIRNEPDLLPGTGIDELIRYDSALQLATRVAREDLHLGGKRIRQGQRVMCMLGAANRDPDQFPDPDKLDLHRPPKRHIAFGYGPHYCIGAPLGRLEAIVAVETILERLPNIQLATEKLEWKASISFRGLRSLPITF